MLALACVRRSVTLCIYHEFLIAKVHLTTTEPRTKNCVNCCYERLSLYQNKSSICKTTWSILVVEVGPPPQYKPNASVWCHE